MGGGSESVNDSFLPSFSPISSSFGPTESAPFFEDVLTQKSIDSRQPLIVLGGFVVAIGISTGPVGRDL